MNLADALALHARHRPDHPAVIDGDETLSHCDLHARVVGATSRLVAAGAARGDIVGVLMADSASSLVSIFAVARIGAIALPIDGAQPLAEIEHVVTSFHVKLLVGVKRITAIAGRPIIDIAAPSNPGLTADAAHAFADDATLPCELATSSGTTGAPKAYLVTHAQQLERFKAIASLGIDAEDRYLALIGMQFNMGLRGCMAGVHFGGTVVLNQRIHTVDKLVATAARLRITWTYLVPGLLRPLLSREAGDRPLLPNIRRLISMGAKLWPDQREIVRRHLTPHLYEIYGATEVGWVTCASPDDHTRRPDSVGRLMPGCALEVVDAAGRLVPPGEVGLVRFRGPGMTSGYHHDPTTSARQFRGGWFYPGDLGIIDVEGYFYYKGRADDVINCDGIKVYPAEIEAVLLSHSAVVEAAVAGWTTPSRQEVPIAFVICRSVASEAELAAYCRERLATHKVPAEICIMSRLPKTANGKVLKRRLTEMFATGDI